ncbi:hypothetical protein FPOA_06407 [Fusarium poae]|uniref:Uncharacterized protein n=1 Tax=Fusarium poae TaxID=36050 RepID=A0A1B8AZF5_FUSPO|nr:hypothetical protein FPOA_06407 [Fusarium poae]
MDDLLRTGSLGHLRNAHPAVPEVPEFMVRKLDDNTNPAFMATPGSGVIYTGSQSWVAESSGLDPIDYDQLYAGAIQAQHTFVNRVNLLCSKRKLPLLDLADVHSWSEVEQSVSNACEALEAFSSRDKKYVPGFTGKLKRAFQKLCRNAGAGTNLTNLVPTDSYCSVLCGGLKIIFKALEETDRYREEIYNTLEELPFILNDNASFMSLNFADEDLHRRAAAIYAAIFGLMEVIIDWFLKRSLVTGVKLFANPTGFSDKLKNQMALVKVAAQRFTTRVAILSTEKQEGLSQQNLTLMYGLGKHSEQVMAEFGDIRSRLRVLDKLTEFFDVTAKAELERQQVRLQREEVPQIQEPAVTLEDVLTKWCYEPDLVHDDCTKILRLQHVPGYDVDRDLVTTIKLHPLFQSWLTLDESSILFIDTRSHNPTGSLEMPIVAAETYRRLDTFINQHNQEVDDVAHIIPLAFFVSQHKDLSRDPNASPNELAMSLLLQLVDHYQDFNGDDLDLVETDVDPHDIEAILFVFKSLVAQLSQNTILILIIDDLNPFTQPLSRKRGMTLVIETLLDIHRNGDYTAKLKFIFGNSSRNDFSHRIFTEDETLRIWQSDATIPVSERLDDWA